MAGPVGVWLNGRQVIEQKQVLAEGASMLEDGVAVDVSNSLDFNGANAICLAVGPNGFVGEVKLRRHPAVIAEIPVTGEFKTQVDADTGLETATLPGAMTALYGWKDDVTIPAEWKGSRVFIDIGVGKIGDFGTFAINNKLVFHPVNSFPAVTWMDITPWVKFGGPNRLTLISKKAISEWTPGTVNYTGIRLQQVINP